MSEQRKQLEGIHHVTAIAGDPQENVDFYVGILGLRLVKRSVNQDDPGTYHLFYADAVGTPGTDLTFFTWPGARHGRTGAGQAVTVSLAVPPDALSYWTNRFAEHRIAFEGPQRRFDEDVLAFSDVHGLAVELVAAPDALARRWQYWADGPVPAEYAIRGIHGVTVQERAETPTMPFLTVPLGFHLTNETNQRKRFTVGTGGSGAHLDVIVDPTTPRGQVAVGTIHHVAWRTPDDDQQRHWWQEIQGLGVSISEIIDRFWFHSIYFREPGGVLFEIATDGPGFSVDEATDDLGTRLVLPPWLEPRRAQIERALPPIDLSRALREVRTGARA